jgi:mono/diheme cytochrome c family protein
MLNTLVKVAQAVVAASCLAFVVLLFFQPDDPAEVQAGPAAAFPDEAAEAIDACEKARTQGNSAASCPEPAAGGEAAPPDATTTTEAGGGEQAAVAGAEVFAANCASCHGRDGGGGIGPNLQDVDDTALVVTTVSNGRGSMPSFGSRLDEAEIEAVADYVANDL